MNPLLTQFLSESRDLLEEATRAFLALEQTPDDTEAMHTVFRAVHTLKGAAGLFDFPAMILLLHAAEDVLSAVRDGQLALTPALVDLLLTSMDRVADWLTRVETTETLPDTAQGEAVERAAQLRAVLATPAAAPPATPGRPTPGMQSEPVSSLPPAWRAALPEAVRRAVVVQLEADTPVLMATYTPEAQCFFSGEDPLHLVRQVPELLAVHIAQTAPWPPLAELDAYRCVLQFHVLTPASRLELEHHFRYVAEQVTIQELMASDLALSGPASTPEGPHHHAQAIFSHVVREQTRILDLPCDDAQWASRLGSVVQTLTNSLTYLALPARLTALATAVQATEAAHSFTPLHTLLQPWIEAASNPHALGAPAPGAAAPPAMPGEPGAADAGTNRGLARTFKIDQDKIDLLMGLIGELVVAKNGLPYVARRAEQHYHVRELGREIKDYYAVMHRITEALHAAIMQVRMLPVSSVFQRFPRLVRDLARKLDKQIALVIEGEDTEADKNVIERLNEPLMHLVRNSIDHGIEGPAERLAAGKPATGTIRLAARQEGDQVVLDIVDDGKGMDPAVIRCKAYEKGLIDEARLTTLTDRDALQLVFAPGFSTADHVSDLSGRGVGLDVVRRAIEACDGTITLDSTTGAGTHMRLTLPLTMAVSRVLIVGEGREIFGIPVDVVVEAMQVPRRLIHTIKHEEVVLWRGRLIPLRRLRRLFHLAEPATAAKDSEAVLVVRLWGAEIGLVVERFHEGVDIILKPLDGILAGCQGVTGTAILGDGRVLLVLNLKEVLTHANGL